MGCFSETCAISAIPIDAGDLAVLIPITKTENPELIPEAFSFWRLTSIPIFGKYNDYGFLENVDKKDTGVKAYSFLMGTSSYEKTLEHLEETRNDSGFVLINRDVWDSISQAPSFFPNGSPMLDREAFAKKLKSILSTATKQKTELISALANDKEIFPEASLFLGISSDNYSGTSTPEAGAILNVATNKDGTPSSDAFNSLMNARDTLAAVFFIAKAGRVFAVGASGPQSGAHCAHWFVDQAIATCAAISAEKLGDSLQARDKLIVDELLIEKEKSPWVGSKPKP